MRTSRTETHRWEREGGGWSGIRDDLAMARLFIAVWPDEDVAERLRCLPRKDRPGIKWVPPENWHVTLRFLGDADPNDVAERLDGLDLRQRTTVARYGPGVDVLAQRVIVVPVGGVDRLAAAVGRATTSLGSEPPRRQVSDHLTVARLKRHARIPNVIGTPFEAEQPVHEIALVESTLRPEGARYDTLATWPVG